MKKLLLIILGITMLSCGGNEPNACMASEQFILKELNYPKGADLPFLECHVTEKNSDKYTVLRKISAVNAFGVETEYIYKVRMQFLGGDQLDDNNWQLLSIIHEEVR